MIRKPITPKGTSNACLNEERGKELDPDPRKLPGETRQCYPKGERKPYILGEHTTKVRIKREGGGRA